MDGGEPLRFAPGERDYDFWLERTRPCFKPKPLSWDCPLTANQLVTILVIIVAIVFVVLLIVNINHHCPAHNNCI